MKRFIKTLEPLSGLPNGFTEVEYLESTTGQYIDTGVGVKSNTVAKAVFSITSNVQGKSYFGARNSTNERFQIVNSFGVGAGYFYNNNIYPVVNKQFEIEMHASGEVYLDGIKRDATNGTFSAVAFDRTLYIFHTNYYDGSGTPTASKFWKVQILEGDTLVRDYIPALDPSGKPCMYDRVEGKPYYNLATTDNDFSYGKQIIPVEYIESSGTQYIDTGIKLNNNSSVELDYQLTQAVQNRKGLFGGLDTGGSKRFGALLSPSNNQLEGGYGSGNEFYQLGLPDTNRHIIKQEKNLLYFDGSLVYTFNTATFTQSFTAPLGNFTYTNYNPASAKYYSSKWWDGDTLIRDYIPVIDENNVGYMLDKLSHTLYENKGTGSFNYGTKVYKPKLRLVEEKAGLSGLPNGFTEVEYLESSGTQYIDTGFVPTSDNFKFEIRMLSQNTSAYLGYRSVNSGTATGDMRWFFNYNDGRVAIRYGNTTENSTLSFDTQTTHKFYFNGSSLYVDDVNYLTTTKKYTTPVYKSFYLFSVNTSGYYSTDIVSFVGRIYYTKIWDNDVLVRDFIPCLDPSGKPCMYDLVGKKTYYNLGTGEFGYGKQIIPVEYLESSGTQYIDTGIKFDGANTKIEVKTYEDSLTRRHSICGDDGNFFYYFRGTGNWAVGYNGTATNIDSYMSVGDVIFVLDKNNVYVNGVLVKTYTASSSVSAYNALLFNRKTSLVDNGAVTMYYCKIWNNDILVRDYIPVIDENNVGYMFDKVSHTLYENKGTGTFNYGTKVYKRRLRLASEPWYKKKYDLLTYLEGTGTQWINTDLKGNLNTKIEAKVYSQKSGSDSGYGIAGDFTTSTKAITMPFNFMGDGLYSRFGDKSITTGIQQQAGTYTFAVDKDGYYVDGTKIATFNTTTSFTTGGTIMLFGFTGLGRNYLKGKMYYTKIWDGTTLVGYFRPAKRKSDNKYGMLDMVTKQFYTNAGTGDFTGE